MTSPSWVYFMQIGHKKRSKYSYNTRKQFANWNSPRVYASLKSICRIKGLDSSPVWFWELIIFNVAQRAVVSEWRWWHKPGMQVGAAVSCRNTPRSWSTAFTASSFQHYPQILLEYMKNGVPLFTQLRYDVISASGVRSHQIILRQDQRFIYISRHNNISYLSYLKMVDKITTTAKLSAALLNSIPIRDVSMSKIHEDICYPMVLRNFPQSTKRRGGTLKQATALLSHNLYEPFHFSFDAA
jgi:hypothetical protein